MVESNWTLTAYCGCKKCCGKEDCVAAGGKKLTNDDAGKVCAAPREIPIGTNLTVSCDDGWSGTLKVVDRGGAIKNHKIDVWMGDKTQH